MYAYAYASTQIVIMHRWHNRYGGSSGFLGVLRGSSFVLMLGFVGGSWGSPTELLRFLIAGGSWGFSNRTSKISDCRGFLGFSRFLIEKWGFVKVGYVGVLVGFSEVLIGFFEVLKGFFEVLKGFLKVLEN